MREDAQQGVMRRHRATAFQMLAYVIYSKHWILTIIEPYKDCVYVMDPLSHRNRDATWKSVVDTAMTIFNATKEKNKFKKPPKWEIVKGPIQPDFKQCGFYVMRFMKEIVMACQDDDSVFVASMFKKREYSMSEINEVQEDWATSAINDL
ncbi:uncharacterized protein LOC131018266 isoform X1 [Salvia miltiorrhiza]|uniref:uncharacterized protein LOC131018266 isoform X1 n=2 Tax=Salvia miltiorrhiza TaxID=226208 RepID=UPI0025AC8515|nr:uncharacterized protein LOC131018266 isoform X1 [Salvia miltiorrhiza]XP_057802977.1 uncharacterized protein LOC131018266 isoform X1 [Salvia miltiorrhiza]